MVTCFQGQNYIKSGSKRISEENIRIKEKYEVSNLVCYVTKNFELYTRHLELF